MNDNMHEPRWTFQETKNGRDTYRCTRCGAIVKLKPGTPLLKRLKLLADWLFDWLILPVVEFLSPKDSKDAGQPQEPPPPDQEPPRR